MKWKNPGNEYEAEYHKISEKYYRKKMYIYGAGMVGGRIYDAVTELTEWEIAGFFDLDVHKKEYKGIQVLHWEEIRNVLDKDCDAYIIIGLTDEIGEKVKQKLIQELKVEETRCILYSEFIMHDFPIISLYQYQKVFLDSLSMIVTEQCTLKCEKCAIMLPYFKELYNYPMEKLEEEIDRLFEMVDFIGNYTVTGGEPLLKKELCDILDYIGRNYRNRIGSFKIITNGMILPKEELLQIMKKYEIAVEISDYTVAVPTIRENVQKSIEAYKAAGIRTYFLSDGEWVDFGFEWVDNQYTEEQLIKFFDYCRTRCRGYVKGKIRYCINAYFAGKALGKEEDSSNYFDIMTTSGTMENKKKLIEFDLGYSKNGYLQMCQHCNGTCEINKNFIEVGKQCKIH